MKSASARCGGRGTDTAQLHEKRSEPHCAPVTSHLANGSSGSLLVAQALSPTLS